MSSKQWVWVRRGGHTQHKLIVTNPALSSSSSSLSLVSQGEDEDEDEDDADNEDEDQDQDQTPQKNLKIHSASPHEISNFSVVFEPNSKFHSPQKDVFTKISGCSIDLTPKHIAP